MESLSEEWMSEDMHGARRLHEMCRVSLNPALQTEEAEQMQKPIAGLSLDKNKTNDRLECDVMFALLRAVRIPEQYVRAEESLYRD